MLILADSTDEEGLLTSFRNACSYRIELAAGGAPVVRAAPPARRRFLPAAAYLLLLLIPVLAAGAWWLRARGAGAPAGVEVASSSKFTPLPERVPPPFGGGEAESLVKRAVGQQAARQTPATPAGAATGPEGAGDPVAQAGGGDPAQRTPQASPGAPLRRFEDRDAWRSLLDQKATFLVHVESYRDSSLGDRTARLRGYGAFGYSLRQTALGEDRWYRLCVGPFETLPAAAAFRDSLLDANAVDYCVITTAADPSARR